MSPTLRERDQQEVDGRGLRLLVLLGTARTSRTWLAATSAEELLVARRLGGASGQTALLAQVEAARGLEHPSLIQPTAVWTAGGALWISRRYGEGVSLRRLIAVTRLAPAHLLAVADDVLSGLVDLHAAGLAHGALHSGNILIDPGGRATAVDLACRVGDPRRDGVPRDEEPDRVGQPAGSRRDLAALAAALRGALAPPGRRAARPGVGAAVPAILGGLLEGEGGPPFAGAATAAEALSAVREAPVIPRPGARREIAALVGPLQHERIGVSRGYARSGPDPSPPGAGTGPALPPGTPPPGAASAPPPPAPGGAGEPTVKAPPVAGAGPATSRDPRAFMGRAGVVLARVATTSRRGSRVMRVGVRRGVSIVLTRVRGVAGVTLRTRAPRWASPRRRAIVWGLPALAAMVSAGVVLAVILPGPPRPAPAISATAPPTPAGTAAPPPATASGLLTPRASPKGRSSPSAPHTAGDVAGLTLTLEDPDACAAAPGRSCMLRVIVDLTPHPEETVAWDLVQVDACTGQAVTDPGTSVTAAAGYAYVWGDSPVTFASTDPVRLYAVSTSPARATSKALRVAGGAGC